MIAHLPASSMSGKPFALLSCRDEEKKAGMADLGLERFERPDKETTQGMFAGSYEKLDSDGLAPPVSDCFKGFRVVPRVLLSSYYVGKPLLRWLLMGPLWWRLALVISYFGDFVAPMSIL
jgi:hypothetical protein